MIDRDEYTQIVREIASQPAWRAQADREADYADGNQLDSDLLRRQRQLGIPPAKENLITQAVRAVCGYEAKTRTDWRVVPDGDERAQDVADALGFRLNQAERRSAADKALSSAFQAATTTGIGWVEVSRSVSVLQYPYRCRYIHRNEIWWDMKAREPDLTDARWLRRRRWVSKAKAAEVFPDHADVIMQSLTEPSFDEGMEGGTSTGLMAAAEAERAWTTAEDVWFDNEDSTVAIDELWYRRWERKMLLAVRGGRAVEYDDASVVHQALLMAGKAKVVEEIVPSVYQSYWIGPHKMHDDRSPYPHDKFPYVAMIAHQEDMTAVPYGIVRDMIFPQDNLNSGISKMRWGMASSRTERTKGAVAMTDEQFRKTISRVDADIILDPDHMARPGARFNVMRDFQLNDQQHRLMEDSRLAIQRVSGITDAFMGRSGSATSGLQEQTQLEQSHVSIAALMDRFGDARRAVGEMLLAMIIEDIGKEEETVLIDGDAVTPPRTVTLNLPTASGISNDVQMSRLLVELDDVPTSSGFRAQQLSALTEAVKSAPAHLQQVILPFMVQMMDLPKKGEVVKAIMDSYQQGDPDAIREQMRREMMMDLKERELDLKEREVAAREKLVAAQAVQTGVQASYSAMQAGAQVAQAPMIAPIADVIMSGAGYRRPDPAGDDPNFPAPGQAADTSAPGAAPLAVRQNTSPTFPPVPQSPQQGATGIETADMRDNL